MVAELKFRFGTDEYKSAKAELEGYQAKLGELTEKVEPCKENKDLQLQEYNDAVAYDGEYADADKNFNSAEKELEQLNADMEKIEQSAKRNKNDEITSYTNEDGKKIRNNEAAADEYNRQKSTIKEKIKVATEKQEAAQKEKERITEERSQKQLKETETEKAESEAAAKELEDLNKEIEELNEKIAPIDEAIKAADADKVDVAAQNNKEWRFYAKKELEAEGIENPSNDEINARAAEILKRNVELGNCDKDGKLTAGKSIVTLTGKSGGVADGMASAEEVKKQYSAAIKDKADKEIEKAIKGLSPEQRAAYNSLPADKQAEIRRSVLDSMNNGGHGSNVSSLISSAADKEIKRAKEEEAKKRAAAARNQSTGNTGNANNGKNADRLPNYTNNSDATRTTKYVNNSDKQHTKKSFSDCIIDGINGRTSDEYMQNYVQDKQGSGGIEVIAAGVIDGVIKYIRQ